MTGLMIAFLVIAVPKLAQAGPWTKSQGDVYAKLGQSVYLADGFVDGDGEFQSGTNYTGHTTSLYGEFGVAPRLHVTSYLPFTVAVNTFEDDSRHVRRGLSDSKLGLQWSPFRKVAFALRAETSIPLYDIGRQPSERAPLLGDGQLDQTVSASYGLSIPKIQSFAFAGVGYQHRTEVFTGAGPDAGREYLDGVVWNAQFGRTFFGRPVLAVAGSGEVPFGANRFTKAYTSVGLTAYVPVAGKLAAEAAAFWTPWARNSARGASYSLGLSFNQ